MVDEPKKRINLRSILSAMRRHPLETAIGMVGTIAAAGVPSYIKTVEENHAEFGRRASLLDNGHPVVFETNEENPTGNCAGQNFSVTACEVALASARNLRSKDLQHTGFMHQGSISAVEFLPENPAVAVALHRVTLHQAMTGSPPQEGVFYRQNETRVVLPEKPDPLVEALNKANQTKAAESKAAEPKAASRRQARRAHPTLGKQ